MLIASNIIHLHFPRVLFHRVLYLWALRAPFSKGPPWGYFPSGTVFFLASFKPDPHREHQPRPPDILPVNVENSFFFGGGGMWIRMNGLCWR